uniref:Histone-lysine N-methyltransferase SETMAR n=1 Tax=Plectus sambesii TaxID=2011161 RepID=A0A914XPQ7_9BILA
MDFEYVVTNVPGPGSNEDDFATDFAGCSCLLECSQASNCSCLPYGDNYDSSDGRLLHNLDSSPPMLECSVNCGCALNDGPCANRRVQLGIVSRLEVFDTGEKGFGLRAVEAIPKGHFICEYAGEVISAEEVDKRAAARPSQTHNYVMTVKEHIGDEVRTIFIDPSARGNLARFINHSCQPNVKLAIVRFGAQVPHVGMFACKEIQAGEELGYFYGDASANTGDNAERKSCLCSSDRCRLFLPYSATASS